MKVLILSVGTGQGHNQVGSALIEGLGNYPDVKCVKLDTFKYINPVLGSSLSEGYLMATKYTPKFYGSVYRKAEKRRYRERLSVFRTVSSVLARKLKVYLKEFSPDVTVCTHVFAAQVLTTIKDPMLTGVKIGVVTDFTIHPFWEETRLDYYITPSEFLNPQAELKGISVDKIKPFGIPVFERFSKRMDSRQAKKLLNIEDKATVLVMGGSMGYGNMLEVFRRLDISDQDFQIVCICGNNTSLKDKINLLEKRKKTYVFGFVNNIDIFMDASDIIVTKPGGLTVSESLAKGIPMILINPIPGQEERNMDFLVENGAALAPKNPYEFNKCVKLLLHPDSKKHEEISNAIKYFSRPQSTKRSCEFITGLKETLD